MSQNDFVISDASGAAVRADANSALQALASGSSGASAPSTMYAYQIWNDSTTGLRKQRNAANSGWIVRGPLAETRAFDRSANTVLGVADVGCFFRATSGFTQTFTALATLADGWWCGYRVEAGATLVFDPNASETIDDATTKTVYGPCSGLIYCKGGTALYTIGFELDILALAEDTAPDNTNDWLLSFDVSAGAPKRIGPYRLRTTQTLMEAAADDTKFLTASSAKWHPGVAKAWCKADVAGAIAASYNMTSVTDNGAGDITFTIATDFSSADYAAFASVFNASGQAYSPMFSALAAGSARALSYVSGTGNVDATNWLFAAWGDQ